MVDQIEPDHLLAALDRLNSEIGDGMSRRIRAAGLELRGSEGRILGLIAPGGTRPTELARGAWISKQAVGKRIRGLVERGLVRLEPDPHDRRAVRVHRTPEGDRVKAFTEEQIADLERDLEGRVGKERYCVFRAVLDELARGR